MASLNIYPPNFFPKYSFNNPKYAISISDLSSALYIIEVSNKKGKSYPRVALVDYDLKEVQKESR